MTIGRCCDHAERDIVSVHDSRAFEALFSTIDGTSADHLTPTEYFGDAAMDGHVAVNRGREIVFLRLSDISNGLSIYRSVYLPVCLGVDGFSVV